MQRLIMMSETYKMASAFYQAEDLQKDPTDAYLWRFPIRRMEAEILRDNVLDASGNLNLQAGGPSRTSRPIPISLRADQPRWNLGSDQRRAGYLEAWRLRVRKTWSEVSDVRGL